MKELDYNEIVETYCREVLTGDVVACDAVKKCVERHLRDIERQDTNNFPFYFDLDEVQRVCSFFPAILRHSLGSMAGQPFYLSPFQVFITSSIFAWKHVETEQRRFTRAHVSIGRKNGKSTWCSGLAILLALVDGEAGAHVYTAATKIEQAKVIYDECCRMITSSEAIATVAEVGKKETLFPFCNAVIKPVASDKPFDGLNPHAVFFDELHAWGEHHRKFYDTMTTGSGSRDQSLQMTITTAGNDQSLLYLEESNYIRQVLDQVVEDDAIFGIIFELDADDDEFDIEVYPKANPNMGTSLRTEYIETQIREAKEKPHGRNRLIRYHANRVVASVDSAFTLDDWRNAESPASDWRNAVAICAGFDLGGEDDLAAYGLCAKFEDGTDDNDEPAFRYEVRSRAYISELTRRDISHEPFSSWIHSGALIKTRYVTKTLRDDLLDDIRQLGITTVAFDPYSARQLGEELESEGIDVVKMPQNCAQFNEPIRTFTQLLKTRKIAHDGTDPILIWAAMNATIVTDRNERFMFDKKSSRDKIDPIVAVLMAYRMASLAQSFSGSFFLA